MTGGGEKWLFPSKDKPTTAGTSTSTTASKTPTIQEDRFLLPNGITVQVYYSIPSKGRNNKNNQSQQLYPPLLFLHGSFHAAWCWTEFFFPYFSSRGYPVVAMSWRGTGGTPAGTGVKKVKASEHCHDLQGLLTHVLPTIFRSTPYATTSERPILISHSFGGIVIMKFLESCQDDDDDDDDDDDGTMEQTTKKTPKAWFAGIVSICSVPPSGNGKMTMRFLRRSLVDSYKITVGFAMRRAITDASLCRDLFFGGQPQTLEDGTVDDFGVSDVDIERYQGYFARDTEATIDLMDLAKKLPSYRVDQRGRAPFVDDLPPCLVIGAKDDFIVDYEGNMETANYYGLDEPVYVDSPHDVMLGRKWENCAKVLEEWIQEQVTPLERRKK